MEPILFYGAIMGTEVLCPIDIVEGACPAIPPPLILCRYT